MPTIIKSIGTAGRDYSTLQAWADAIPANLVTDGNSYVGEVYNDSEFSSGSTLLTISGKTTDATHTITLRPAAGQGFRDNPNVRTNALRYNQANGVALKLTGTYAQAINISSSNVTVDGLQVTCTGSPTQGVVVSGASTANVTVQNSVIAAKPAASTASRIVSLMGASNQKIVNCVLVADTANACGGVNLSSGAEAINCTIVRPSSYAAAGTAMLSQYGTAVARNCAIFGFATPTSGTFNADGHNLTDLASAPGTTGNLASKTFANQFVGTTSAAQDWRLVSTSDGIDAGTTDTTDIPSAADISGTSRPQGAAWDIGAWEYASAASGVAGTASWTESNDTSSASATATVAGSSATTEAPDVTSASGSVGSAVAGYASWTETNDTATAAGTVTVTGSAVWTEAPDTASVSGNVAANPSASLAWVESDDTTAFTGQLSVSGTLSSADDADSVVIAGAVQFVSGSLGWIEDADTCALSARLDLPLDMLIDATGCALLIAVDYRPLTLNILSL